MQSWIELEHIHLVIQCAYRPSYAKTRNSVVGLLDYAQLSADLRQSRRRVLADLAVRVDAFRLLQVKCC